MIIGITDILTSMDIILYNLNMVLSTSSLLITYYEFIDNSSVIPKIIDLFDKILIINNINEI